MCENTQTIFMKKKSNVWQYIIISLSVLLLSGIFVTISFAWFNANDQFYGQINTANIDFTINGNLHPLNSENSKIITGDFINNPISITNKKEGVAIDRQESIFVRFYLIVDNDVSAFLSPHFNDFSKWVYSIEDNGYYYLGVVEPNETISIIEGIDVSQNLQNTLAGQDVGLEIKIDAIQSKYQAYETLWEDAPTLWIEYINGIKQN